MNAILTIAKKEFRSYFLSPIAYVYIVTFLVVVDWLFFRGFFISGQAEMRDFFFLLPWVFLFFIPAVAMGKWSEEKKMGTIELILTQPVKDLQVVVGKFLASLALIGVSIALTVSVPITVALMGDLDIGPVIGGYIGLILIGAAYLSIGLFISALTENQIIAFIIGVVVTFVLLIVGEPLFTLSVPSPLISTFQYLGLANHFASVTRGVIDSRDIIYYISIIGFFLWLNLTVVEARGLKKNFRERAAVVATVLVALFVVNFLSSRHFVRIDLTEGNEYTLSQSTKRILKGLDDVVNVNIYFSKDLPPQLAHVQTDVDDILSDYKTYAGSRLKIQHIDPLTSPQDEAKIQMMGIPPLQLNVIKKDKQELAKIYLGMTVMQGDKKEVIPVVQNVSGLEYQLTSAILKVARKESPTIAWFAGKSGDLYKEIKKFLKFRYEIVDLTSEKFELDKDKYALLVLTPDADMETSEISKIEDLLSAGGKVVFMPNRLDISQKLAGTEIPIPNIEKFLEKNGVSLEKKITVDRMNANAAFDGGYVTYHVPYPFWVSITREDFNKDMPAVAELESLILPWSAPIAIDRSMTDGPKVTTLATTTSYGRGVPLDSSLMPEPANQYLGLSGNGPLTMAVLIEGKGSMVLVGGSRFIQDNFLGQFGPNSIFMENIADSMAMGNDLVGIRSKGATERPIGEVSQAGVIFAKYINVIGSPILLLLCGGAIFIFRKREMRELKKIYG